MNGSEEGNNIVDPRTATNNDGDVVADGATTAGERKLQGWKGRR